MAVCFAVQTAIHPQSSPVQRSLCLSIQIGETMEAANLLQDIPACLPDEILQTLVAGVGMRIERIVSNGHCSPPGFWYDQDQAEWVLLVKGEARLRFAEPERVVHMTPGVHVTIAAHEKHRVEWTALDTETIWVAVFFSASNCQDTYQPGTSTQQAAARTPAPAGIR
jgi:cupin 2 domain-containing protein